ncbi:MAG: cyclase family protein [Chloroflexi bacterium]|nr:cyclase family protein [Chloroflexota bacterium]
MEEVHMETNPYTWHVFTFFAEAGTRFILPGFRPQYRFDDVRTLETVALDNKLIERNAVIIDVPKGPGDWIRPEDLEKAVSNAPVQQGNAMQDKPGDAFIIRTGWGDDERYLKLGLEFREKSPHFTDTAVDKLLELLAVNDCDMWLYDTCEMTTRGVDPVSGRPGSFGIRSGLTAVGGIVNAGAIKKPRVKLVVLPIPIRDAWMTPCRVIAMED